MKTLSTLLILSLTSVLLSFNGKTTTHTNKLSYVFITSVERDRALHKSEGAEGYAEVSTNIVSFDCNLKPEELATQFIDQYSADQKTKDRFLFWSSGNTKAWVYESYDKAMAARTDKIAKTDFKHTRVIKKFRVSCD